LDYKKGGGEPHDLLAGFYQQRTVPGLYRYNIKKRVSGGGTTKTTSPQGDFSLEKKKEGEKKREPPPPQRQKPNQHPHTPHPPPNPWKKPRIVKKPKRTTKRWGKTEVFFELVLSKKNKRSREKGGKK